MPSERPDMEKVKSAAELEQLRQSILQGREPSKPCITICGGAGCRASGAEKVIIAYREECDRRNMQVEVELKETGCHGFCERGPLVVIRPKNIFYQRVSSEDAEEIISKSVLNGDIVERLLYTDPLTNERVTTENEVPF